MFYYNLIIDFLEWSRPSPIISRRSAAVLPRSWMLSVKGDERSGDSQKPLTVSMSVVGCRMDGRRRQLPEQLNFREMR
jgi:hypothetical protein